MRFLRLEPPDLGVPEEVPELPPALYRSRYERLEAAREDAGFDALLIYADREHSANLAWLSGFDPRFEEALWLQLPDRTPTLLVGNENLDYAPGCLELEADVRLYQPFGLPGQDRSRSSDLRSLLRKAGLERGMKLGSIGWKPQQDLELPYWIVEVAAGVTGALPANGGELLMDPGQGLRTVLEPEMIVFAEYAAMLTSEGVRGWLHGLREGMNEREAAAALQSFGLELSCHPMVNFGRPLASGLGSARNARAKRGEYAQVAFGVIGGLTCRAGRLVAHDDPDTDDYLALVGNYLEVVRAWYGALALGATGGEVVAAAEAARAETWDVALNPGHLIHLDEWLASPFALGSGVPLRSGMAIQQDIIPAPRASPATLNMEDGLVLADAELQRRLEVIAPDLMVRCRTRRAWMERLGYALAPEVLPLGNLAGAFFPFLLEPAYVARFDSA